MTTLRYKQPMADLPSLSSIFFIFLITPLTYWNKSINLSYMTCHFIDQIENPSLNLKVNDAISLRNKGHFNKAMLKISEGNRDQVIAIRKIQRILDEANWTEIKGLIVGKILKIANTILKNKANLDSRDLKILELSGNIFFVGIPSDSVHSCLSHLPLVWDFLRCYLEHSSICSPRVVNEGVCDVTRYFLLGVQNLYGC